MKLSSSEQDSIIALLTRIYGYICEIEEEYQLLAGEGDFRARIEYFHDAVRAASSKDARHREPGGRLAVEYLAYDLSCLRFLRESPLAPFKPHGQLYSTKTDLVALGHEPTVKAKRPDRVVRERLSELYQHYAVLFAALLKPNADQDYHERVDHLNQDVEDISAVAAQCEALAKNKGSVEALTSAIQHLEDAGLRQALMAFMQKQKYKKKDDLKIAVKLLKDETLKKDKVIAGIESAHMNYALAQLGIYENSKDMLKKMAMQGMNLVGRFVESSIAEARREMGR